MATNSMHVYVTSEHKPNKSIPSKGIYVFSYTVHITNNGTQSAQLISRHWIIADAMQTIRKVSGLGVVGKQPLIAPGGTFQYSSNCQLDTAVGSMRGSYVFASEDGKVFEVPIPEFVLAAPQTLH